MRPTLFSLTYPHAPAIYYGDELEMHADGIYHGTALQDDLYNRAPFPWDDTPGSYTAYTATLPFL